MLSAETSHCLIKISRNGQRCPRFLFSICEIRILSENAKAVMVCKLVPMIWSTLLGIITYLTVIIPCDWIGFFSFVITTRQISFSDSYSWLRGWVTYSNSNKGSRQKELDDCVNDSDVIGIISYPLQHNRFHLPPVAIRNLSSPELDASNFIWAPWMFP